MEEDLRVGAGGPKMAFETPFYHYSTQVSRSSSRPRAGGGDSMTAREVLTVALGGAT